MGQDGTCSAEMRELGCTAGGNARSKGTPTSHQDVGGTCACPRSEAGRASFGWVIGNSPNVGLRGLDFFLVAMGAVLRHNE